MDEEEKYPLVIGLTFIFNLLLGTGVLAIPHVFKEVGYLLGSVVIVTLGAMSYLSVTFLLETMANANFVSRLCGLGSAVNVAPTSTSTTSASASQPPSPSEHSSTSEEGSEEEVRQSAQQTKVGSSFLNAAFELSSSEEIAKNVASADRIEPVRIKPSINSKLPPPLTGDLFSIDAKFELGDLTGLFLHPRLSQLFLLSLIVYLFGDLLIFNAMMAKSMREISCSAAGRCANLTSVVNYDDQGFFFDETPGNSSSSSSSSSNGSLEDRPCWPPNSTFAGMKLPVMLSRGQVYQLYLLLFVSALLPLTYAGLKKTQSIQVVTIVLRWLAFISMVGLALRKILLDGGASGHPGAANLRHVPKMFGVCVYGFMVHHSVPSILTPIRSKRRLLVGLQLDYLIVAGCYLLIAASAAFAFPTLEDVYTLNFQADDCHHHQTNSTSTPAFFTLFLPTYPVFTMFSSYTMIALTLINNLKVLARGCRLFAGCSLGLVCTEAATGGVRCSSELRHLLTRTAFPLVAMLPPLAIALFTENVGRLVGFVGSYAGGLIQYVFPALLVYASRRAVQQRLLKMLMMTKTKPEVLATGNADQEEVKRLYRALNAFASPLQSHAWILLTGAWWLLSLVLVTLDHASLFD